MALREPGRLFLSDTSSRRPQSSTIDPEGLLWFAGRWIHGQPIDPPVVSIRLVHGEKHYNGLTEEQVRGLVDACAAL